MSQTVITQRTLHSELIICVHFVHVYRTVCSVSKCILSLVFTQVCWIWSFFIEFAKIAWYQKCKCCWIGFSLNFMSFHVQKISFDIKIRWINLNRIYNLKKLSIEMYIVFRINNQWSSRNKRWILVHSGGTRLRAYHWNLILWDSFVGNYQMISTKSVLYHRAMEWERIWIEKWNVAESFKGTSKLLFPSVRRIWIMFNESKIANFRYPMSYHLYIARSERSLFVVSTRTLKRYIDLICLFMFDAYSHLLRYIKWTIVPVII